MGSKKPGPIFPGARNASTTSAWASNFSRRANVSFSPSPLSSSFSPPDTSATSSSSRVKWLSSDALDAARNDPVALIEGIKILRMYISFDEIPFALLDALYNFLQGSDDLEEIHLCIQSHLRPAIQDINDNFGLQRALTSAIRKWSSLNTALKFFFLLPDIDQGSHCIIFTSYQEANVLTAIKDLNNTPAELTENLALAERSPPTQPPLMSGPILNNRDSGDIMDVDEYL